MRNILITFLAALTCILATLDVQAQQNSIVIALEDGNTLKLEAEFTFLDNTIKSYPRKHFINWGTEALYIYIVGQGEDKGVYMTIIDYKQINPEYLAVKKNESGFYVPVTGKSADDVKLVNIKSLTSVKADTFSFNTVQFETEIQAKKFVENLKTRL